MTKTIAVAKVSCRTPPLRGSHWSCSPGTGLTQQDFLDFLPRMVYLQDEPIADPVCMPVYFLSKLARDHGVVVAQAGEGADGSSGAMSAGNRSST